MAFSDDQIKALNRWARTDPALRGVFPYTNLQGIERNRKGFGDVGLGDLLASTDFDSITADQITAGAFYLKVGGELTRDHGELDGLLDDDHTQYILADGTRAFTGNVNFGEFNLTGIGLITGDNHVEGSLTAEAFYTKDGGEITPGPATDHGTLLGLADDDHPQYILADGTRAFTGNVNFGGFNLTGIGLITGDNHVTGSLTAEAFYIKDGGELTRDHGSLDGLGDDDHTQYLLIDGTRAMTGALSMGSNQINNVGAPTADTDAARLVDIGPAFYGVVFKESEAGGFVQRSDTLTFDSDFFYLSSGGDDKPILSFLGGSALTIDHGALTGLGDDDHTQYILADGTRAFTGNVDFGGFNLTGIGLITGDNHVTGSLTAEAFYIKDGGELTRDHGSLDGLGDDDHTQYLLVDGTRAMTGALNMGSNQINSLAAPTLDNDAARLVDVLAVGPLFYGITAKHQDSSASFSGLEVFSFDEEFFYLTQNNPNTDEVQISLRNLPSGNGGEANTASNRAGDEGIFFQKTEVNLEFKSLTAGTNITLSSTDDAITISSTAAGASPFYGLTVKHSDDSESFKGINTIAFDENFYLTQNTTNTDEVHVNFRGDTGAAKSQSFGTLVEWIFSHNLNTSPVLWDTFDDNNEAIIPDRVAVSDPDTAYFYFKRAISGTAIVSSGGGGTGSAATTTVTTSMTIENPTAFENLTIFKTKKNITVNNVEAIIRGSNTPSVDFYIVHNPVRTSNIGNNIFNNTAVTANSVTTGNTFTLDGDTTVPSDSFIWLETTSKTGQVNELNLLIEHTED